MKKIHFAKSIGSRMSACGPWWKSYPFNKITRSTKRVTCGNCKRTKVFKDLVEGRLREIR